MEPEGCGVKIGERMLLPGEDKKLLMAPTSSATPGIVSCSEPSTSPAPSPCPSASSASSISSSSMMEAALVAHPYPTDDAEGMAAAYAAHAGPQSYLYPTISPSSILAQQLIDQGMAAASAESAATTKPFVKQVGKEGGGSGTSEASPPVLIPPLPSPDESPPHALMGGNSNKKNGGGETVSIRTIKKAGLQQEGVVVNAEVLQQNIVREKESEGAAASAAAVPSSSSDPVAPSPSPSSSCSAEFGPTLNSARSCYCCKNRFFQLHFFYSEFCPPCAKLNYAKRNQSADLRGKIILLTGSRVKIGFRCGLKLLRCGATVIATSRFPHDTARRYAEEKDFGEWKERLHIYGLDLRDLKSVVHLSDILCQRYDRLDGIINNAAQTVRRPPAYYRHLMPIECMEVKEMPDQWREVVKGDLHQLAQEQQQSRITSAPAASSSPSSSSSVAAAGVTVEDISHLPSDAHATASSQPHTVSEHPAAAATVAASAAVPSGAAAAAPASSSSLSAFQRNDDLNSALLTTLNRAAALSQLPLLPSDHAHPLEQALFPENRFDVTGQQLDLRSINSWNLNLDQIDPSELVEVFAINALSPFLLNSRLKSLMLRGGSHPVLGPSVQTTDKYIINVSAMEGKFYRHKSG